jgi:hypothetical protein
MGILRPLLGFALVLAIPAIVLSGQNKGAVPKKGLKKDQSRAVRGTVVEVHRDGDSDNGYFTVRVHDKKSAKGTAKKEYERRKFQVLPVTKFEIVRGGKHEKASFKDLHEGDHVAVYPMDDRPTFARLVEIREGKKKPTN